jgi:hypothetical protein
MFRSLVYAFGTLLTFAAAASAFEVEATIKRVDAEKGVLYFNAVQQDRTARVGEGAPILDEAGKDLANGLKSSELKEGAVVTLSIERVDNQPVIRSIRLLGKAARPVPAKDGLKQDTSGLIPLIDLGDRTYQSFPGGLYPDGKNTRPEGHDAAGRAMAEQVRPLDADGKPSDEGKIVLLGIGFSNTVQAFNGFKLVARDDEQVSPKIVLVNGAVGGMSAEMVQDPDKGRGALYWATVDDSLKSAGVTRAQVQVVWIKETNPSRNNVAFPKGAQELQAQIGKIVEIVPRRFPNVKLAYLSSRTYGGWAKPRPDGTPPGNREPYSYETGFAVKWLIEAQLKGDPALNFDPSRGPVQAPWLSWGPYLWANGPEPRADGFRFALEDFMENDRMHESPVGQRKIGNLLLQFFKSDSTTRGWFLRDKAR